MHARDPERGPGQGLTSLVFPAYNPGPRLERTWQAVQEFLRQAPGRWEVLFVCDGCTDGTAARLAGLVPSASGTVRVISYAPNRGKGYAVRRGLAEAAGQWRLFTDIDLAYGLEDVIRVARTLWAGAAVAIASRAHPESRVLVPTRLQGYAYRRHLQGQLFTVLARLLLPVRQRDTQAGLKGLSAAAAHRLLPLLRCDGFGFDCELLTACARHGVAVTEVPVCLRYEDADSTTGFRAMTRMVQELLQIRHAWRQPPAAVPVQAIPLEPGRREAA
jgi:dolichyl-phosphate beta-glucosyltransferase